jgi:hypothetical protein
MSEINKFKREMGRFYHSRWFQPLLFSFAIMVAAISISTMSTSAQMQQSGGAGSNASVGTTGATAPTSAALGGGTYNSSLPTLTNGQMGSEQLDSNARQIIVGGGVAGTPAGGVVSVQGVAAGTVLPVSGTVSVNALPAGANLIGYSRAQNGCGTTNYEAGLQYLPSSITSLTATTTCVGLLVLNNVTAGAVTVTVQDQTTNCNAAACQIISSFSIPGNSSVMLPLYGSKFTSGIKWSASATNSIVGNVIGNQ